MKTGRLGDGASLGDIKCVAGFTELCAIAVREAEPGQNSIGVIDTGFISGQRMVGAELLELEVKLGIFRAA